MSDMQIARVLIVEDDPMVRRLLVRHFQKKDATVVDAATAEDALALFQQPGEPFDAVVTDVHLPGMSGVDLATHIRGVRPDQPIVFVTGDVDEDLARRALEGGSAGYLLKPFEFFELDAALGQALRTPVVGPRAPVTSSPSNDPAADPWLMEQRRLLMEAAARPISLQPVHGGRSRFNELAYYVKRGTLVLVLLLIAWFIGFGLAVDPREGADVSQPDRQSPVSAPYQPPPPERPRR
ncbi:MAG: response regulator [Gemmatimonadota bacterium]